jgi:hypothetical protein
VAHPAEIALDLVTDECLQGDLGGPLGSSVTQHYCDPTFINTHQQ